MFNLVLASKSKVRKDILNKHGINCIVEPSNVDEEPVKNSLFKRRCISGNCFKKLGRAQG